MGADSLGFRKTLVYLVIITLILMSHSPAVSAGKNSARNRTVVAISLCGTALIGVLAVKQLLHSSTPKPTKTLQEQPTMTPAPQTPAAEVKAEVKSEVKAEIPSTLVPTPDTQAPSDLKASPAQTPFSPSGIRPYDPGVFDWNPDLLGPVDRPGSGSILFLSPEDQARLAAERKVADEKALQLKLAAEEQLRVQEAARLAEEHRIQAEIEKQRLEEERLMKETLTALENILQPSATSDALKVIQKNLERHSGQIITEASIRRIFYAVYRMPIGQLEKNFDTRHDRLVADAIQLFSSMNQIDPEAHVWTTVTQTLAEFRRYKWSYDYRAPWILSRAGKEANSILKAEHAKPNIGGLSAYEVMQHIAEFGDASDEAYLEAEIVRAKKEERGDIPGWFNSAHRNLFELRVRFMAQSQTSDEAELWAKKVLSQMSSKVLETADGETKIRNQALVSLLKMDQAHPEWKLLETLNPELSAASHRGPDWIRQRIKKILNHK